MADEVTINNVKRRSDYSESTTYGKLNTKTTGTTLARFKEFAMTLKQHSQEV